MSKTASQEWYADRKKDRVISMTGNMVCKDCGEDKLVTDFGTHPNMANGRRSSCKKCRSASTIDWFNNRGGKKFRTIEKKRKYKKTQKERFPEKYKARTAVSNAIACGTLTADKECNRCGSDGLLHGHHPDYSKPLEVEWLCVPCHTKEHAIKEK